MATGAPEGVMAASRPVERLSGCRIPTDEPKESMNCKSCRKRKIKCNRVKPACEACQVFKVPCIYDAIPKKRGPKTDVLEALLRRVNGLEKRLKDENKSVSPVDATDESATTEAAIAGAATTAATINTPATTTTTNTEDSDSKKQVRHFEEPSSATSEAPARDFMPQTEFTFPAASPIPLLAQPQQNNGLLDVFFGRLHAKPYYILDEAATRQRWQANQLPVTIVNGLHAVAARYAPHLVGGHNAAVRLSEECAIRARMALDSDEPTIENLQGSLLLVMAFFQAGKGKKSYMLLSNAVSMALALGLHRELPPALRISPAEREGRRKLFWTCYLMDRFTATGSKRPSLIDEESIRLRLPAWPTTDSTAIHYEGNYFSNGNNMPLSMGPGGRIGQSTDAALVDIVRLLGVTNRYLAAGGVKGDSHFPWHVQSNLSRIRQDLDIWAGSNQDAFLSIDTLFAPQDDSSLILAKFVYHLVHCLIYRPFLPVDLQELAETGQHQSWQIEATTMCFLHANAIAELVELSKASPNIHWPSFVGYCISTAGTVHVNGAHYAGREGDIFARSAEFLSREMAALNEMCMQWAGVQHQRETLQTVYGCHSQLVKALATNPMRFSSVYQMEDFFDRYPGQYIDGAHNTLADVSVESVHESLPAYDGLSANPYTWDVPRHDVTTAMMPPPPRIAPSTVTPSTGTSSTIDDRPKKKRRRKADDPSKSPTKASPLAAIDATTAPQMQVDHGAQHITHQPSTIPSTHADQSSAMTANTSNVALTTTAPDSFTQNPFSPSYTFSPWPTSFSQELEGEHYDTTSLQTHDQHHNRHPPHQHYDPDNGPNALHAGFGPMTTTTVSMDAQQSQTPGGLSANGSALSETDKDPFLSLLEQLAENDGTPGGGPSDLDFFLSGAQ